MTGWDTKVRTRIKDKLNYDGAKVPNERTQKTPQESDEGKNFERFKSLDDLLKSLKEK